MESVEDIIEYVDEAIANQKQGKELKPDLNKPIIIPDELEIAFSNDTALREAFSALSKTQRREYAQHINRAKQVSTRERRLKKIIALIRQSQ